MCIGIAYKLRSVQDQFDVNPDQYPQARIEELNGMVLCGIIWIFTIWDSLPLYVATIRRL